MAGNARYIGRPSLACPLPVALAYAAVAKSSFPRPYHCLGAVRDLELAEDVGDVVAHRLQA